MTRNWSSWAWGIGGVILTLAVLIPIVVELIQALIAMTPPMPGMGGGINGFGLSASWALGAVLLTIMIGLAFVGAIKNSSHTGSIWVARVLGATSAVFGFSLLAYVGIYGGTVGIQKLGEHVGSIPTLLANEGFYASALVMVAIAVLIGGLWLAVISGKAAGWFVAFVAGVILWIGVDNFVEVGQNFGEGVRDVSRGTKFCVDNPDDPTCQSARTEPDGPETVAAGSSGNIIAPVNDWSEWRRFRQGSCFRVWTANPDVQDVRVRFQNAEGDIFRNMDNEEYMNDTVAISVRSELGAPVRVSYEIWGKAPGERCRKA
jgi:hypothetical protein